MAPCRTGRATAICRAMVLAHRHVPAARDRHSKSRWRPLHPVGYSHAASEYREALWVDSRFPHGRGLIPLILPEKSGAANYNLTVSGSACYIMQTMRDISRVAYLKTHKKGKFK